MPEDYEKNIPLISNPQPAPEGPETFEEKFIRKFKEQPLVPIGTGLTCLALVSAIVQQRRGRSRNMNNWLWARIAFQGFTVVTLVAGTLAMGRTKQQLEARQESAAAHAQQESAEFAVRLKAAENAHAAEMQGAAARAEFARADGVDKREPAGVHLLRSAAAKAGPAGDQPAGVQLLKGQARETDKQAGSWWQLWK